MTERPQHEASATVSRDGNGACSVCIVLRGTWTMAGDCPDAAGVLTELPGDEAAAVTFETSGISAWDSSLLVFLGRLVHGCDQRGLTWDASGLPLGAARLLGLARAGTAQPQPGDEPARGRLATVGLAALQHVRGIEAALDFIGRVTLGLVRMVTGRAQFRRRDLWQALYDCGPAAVPIVTLVTFLSGLILAFIGAIQLRLFGAQIYVADLVGIGIVRAMGAIMAGVVMAGRTGAAYAAQLGTMQVNEEIDALETLGISPVEFLVLPRILALVITMPLLCLYADVMGILGGLAVGLSVLDLELSAYLLETRAAVSLSDFAVGLFTGLVFGVLIALCGCYRGLACGRSSAAVGRAATSAVVTTVVSLVIAMAAITVLCEILGV